MALTANVDTDIELFLGESFPKALSALHFSRNEMMKGERNHPTAASAGQYRFCLRIPGITLRRQSPRRSDREAHRYRGQRLNRT